MTVLLSILGIGVFSIVVMMVINSLSTIGMSSEKTHLERADLSLDSDEMAFVADLHGWAESSGFEWIDAYWGRFPMNCSPFISAWKDQAGTFMTCYRIGTIEMIDFFTILDEDRVVSLTTGNPVSGIPHPLMPGAMMQSFPRMSAESLHAKHLEALDFVNSQFGLHPISHPVPFEDCFLGWLRRLMRFVRSHSFWPIRSIWWYLRRKKYQGIPVSERYAEYTLSDLMG
jgi:hypothetical protein